MRMTPFSWTRGGTPRHVERRSVVIVTVTSVLLSVAAGSVVHSQSAGSPSTEGRGYEAAPVAPEPRALSDAFEGMDRGAADAAAADRGRASAEAAGATPEANASSSGEKFKSPDSAVKGMVEALRAGDNQKLEAIFGPIKGVLDTGDSIADRRERERFLKYYDQKHSLDNADGVMVTLTVGDSAWPFPIPIVKHTEGYYFNTAAGAQLIVHRRIGRNELGAISVCNAYLAAQKEYALVGHDGLPEGLYAQTLVSDQGKQNGLYWPAAADALRSPMGPLVAQASSEGYRRDASGKPTPYHGYYFKPLNAQGARARDGAKKYIVDGKQVGGFALIAYPAQYAQSGVKTFIVNQDGVLYEKNLGDQTAKVASAINEFNPDGSWTPGH